MYLQRLQGRKSIALKDMTNDPVVVELKNGKVYGGRLDGYYYSGGGVVKLYSCKLLDTKSYRWVGHDVMERVGDELIRADMPWFWIADMKNIFVLPEGLRDKLELDDALQIYIDPHYIPFTGVRCSWEPGEDWESTEENHAPECDARLHEALSFLMTMARLGIIKNAKAQHEKRERRRQQAFDYIRRRLLMYEAKIP